MNETFNITYLTIENGKQTLKVGKMMFQNGVPVIIYRELSDGSKLCFPIPKAAIHRLRKTTDKNIQYHFPDVLLPPPDFPTDQPHSKN